MTNAQPTPPIKERELTPDNSISLTEAQALPFNGDSTKGCPTDSEGEESTQEMRDHYHREGML